MEPIKCILIIKCVFLTAQLDTGEIPQMLNAKPHVEHHTHIWITQLVLICAFRYAQLLTASKILVPIIVFQHVLLLISEMS